MLHSLKDHPFAVTAELERTVVLSYAVPCDELRPLVPSFLEIDAFQEQWGFVAVAIVHTKGLRPSGFPKWLGNDFWLVGYRVFVRYRNAKGKRLRGLYILGSETDKRRMVKLGNLFTHYKYTYRPLDVTTTGHRTGIRSIDNATYVGYDDDPHSAASLPATSVFADWSEARRFVGPLPFTFSHDAKNNRVLIVEGERADWVPRPVTVFSHSFSFLDKLPVTAPRLSNAFVIDHVPYTWKRGELETLTS